MKSIKFLALLLIITLLSGRIYSQVDDLKKGKTIDIQPSGINLTDFDILRQIEPSATGSIYNAQSMEGPVDPDKYIVGPNDIFSLGLWGIINQPLPMSVSPEGSLIIPTVGEVNVSGLTLKDAKEKVIAKVKQRYISTEITLTLVLPRRFKIIVTGVGQGAYDVLAVERASSIISYIFSDSASLLRSGTSPSERYAFSFRNIQLTRKNGETIRIDLRKYFATRDDKFNPFLREGDIINLPKYDWEGKFISVQGAVQFPGVFEFIDGDDLETAIQLVRGVTSVANLDSIQISRLTPDAKKMSNFYVKFEESKKVKLQPNDRITVMAYAEQRRDFRVYVLGEIVRPGLYPITLGETHLSEIIRMTGGFTAEAYLPTSELYRKVDTLSIQVSNRDSLEHFFTERLSDVISNRDEKENFERETKYKIGRVIVDFEKLFLKGDNSQDVILRPGDIIYIGDNKKQVYVYGQVRKPGYVPYKEAADYMYYIEKAGGYGDRADESEVRVIKFKTREWIDPDDAKIESNDFVYVPKILKRDFAYDIDLIAKVASVIVSVITLALLIIQTQK